MIDKYNMDRIIGEYIEVNADIIDQEFNSKFPKFIAKMIANKQRSKLLKSVDKFVDSEYVLSWMNLLEFFTLLNSNYYDEEYGHVKYVKFGEYALGKILEVAVIGKQYNAIIRFDQIQSPLPPNMKFELIIRNNNNDSMDIYINKLSTELKKNTNIVKMLNDDLKVDIANYIYEIVDPEERGVSV